MKPSTFIIKDENGITCFEDVVFNLNLIPVSKGCTAELKLRGLVLFDLHNKCDPEYKLTEETRTLLKNMIGDKI